MSTVDAPAAGGIPADHHVTRTIDLAQGQPARALQLLVLLGVATFVVPALAGDFPPASDWSTAALVAVTAAAILAYSALHELTHGLWLRILTGVRPTYGVRFPFLTTASTVFLTRSQTIIVCLAPFITWGAVFTVALMTLPDAALLSAYILAALNLAGSAGDFVQAFITARLRPGVLLRDSGHVTTVIAPGEAPAATP